MSYKQTKQYKILAKDISYSINEGRDTFEKKLKDLASKERFSSDLYNKGEQWFNSGLTLDEAPDELKNNNSFLNGFMRGHRLAIIEKLNKQGKSR